MFPRRALQIAAVLLLYCPLGCAPEPESKLASTPEETKPADEIDPSLIAYLEIGDRLAGDKVEGIDAAVSAMESGIPTIHTAALPLRGLALKPARAQFLKVTTAVLAHLRANPDARHGLILVYCPMTFAGKGGHWVQREGEVRNPYEGSRMLTCGDKQGWDRLPGA